MSITKRLGKKTIYGWTLPNRTVITMPAKQFIDQILLIDHYEKGRLRFGTFTVRRSLMKQSSAKWVVYLFSFVFLIISCAGTELTRKQTNEVYKGKPASYFIKVQGCLDKT